MNRILRALVVVLTVVSTSHAQQDHGPDSLKGVVAQLTTKVKETATSLKQTSVNIGLFTGSQDALKIGVGGGSFMAELELSLGNFADPKAELELNGQVLMIDDPATEGLKTIRIIAKLIKKNGDTVAEFKELNYIRKATDFARFTGPTVAFKPDTEYKQGPGEGRRQDAQNSLPEKPGLPPKQLAFVKGSIIRSSEHGKIDVEILSSKDLKGKFAPLTATLKDEKHPGVPVVDIDKDAYYYVRVKNNDTVEVGVFLHLDGIDQFTFSENRLANGRPKYTCWILGAGEEIVIKGWHKNVGDEKKPGEVFSFVTTQAGKGAASKFPTLSQGKIGTIGVGIASVKAEGTKGPGLETGVGPPIVFKQQEVKRSVAEPHEFITVRYSR